MNKGFRTSGIFTLFGVSCYGECRSLAIVTNWIWSLGVILNYLWIYHSKLFSGRYWKWWPPWLFPLDRPRLCWSRRVSVSVTFWKQKRKFYVWIGLISSQNDPFLTLFPISPYSPFRAWLKLCSLAQVCKRGRRREPPWLLWGGCSSLSIVEGHQM